MPKTNDIIAKILNSPKLVHKFKTKNVIQHKRVAKKSQNHFSTLLFLPKSEIRQITIPKKIPLKKSMQNEKN